MSENLGGFRSSPVGFAEGLLTFPGMGSTYLSLWQRTEQYKDVGSRPG